VGEVLAMILAAGGAGGVFVWLLAYSQASMKRLEDAWIQAASELGGQFTRGESGWLSSKPMSIEATVDGTPVLLDHYAVSNGRSSTSYTRLRARAQTATGFKLSLHEQGVLASVSKALGAQDVEVGDRRFDEAFVVKTNDEGLAKAWLGPRVTAAVWGWQRALSPLPYSYRLEDGVVTATRVGIERMSPQLAQAARATAALAGRGVELRASWRQLAHDLEGIAETELWGGADPTIEVQARGASVTVEVAYVPSGRIGEMLVTRVWARRSAASTDRFTAAEEGTLSDEHGHVVALEGRAKSVMELRSTHPDVTAGRFDRELSEALDAVAPARLIAGDREVTVVFTGLELQAALLRSAVRLVAGLTAVDPAGPYR
jgi:hypothetical protein